MPDSWTETGVVWNNQPAVGALAGHIGASGTTDLTLSALQSVWADGVISFQLWDSHKLDAMMKIVSKEGSATGAARLRIEHSSTGGSTSSTTGPASTSGNNGGTFNFVPIADSYARGGQFAGATYGASATLSVKSVAGSTEWSRESFLKFNLNSLGNQAIQSAVLVLKSTDNIPLNFDVASVTNDQWTEGALSWNNKPNSGAVIGHVGANGEATLSVSGLGAIRGNDGIVSLRLVDNQNSDVLMNFYSKEGPSNMVPILRIRV